MDPKLKQRRKYFNLEYNHNTLDYIYKILEEKQPKNVVTILCDGMGLISWIEY